ncbi:MAG: hypothetical protein HY289_10765, partial [Planctomycetes bacterium]|nr:hypothetical protein [Planctomycetota bacterium]
NIGTPNFSAGYVQVSYFLTGESRTYDKRMGRLGSEYIAKANTPFWLVRDDNGAFNWGLGAWEVAARYSTINLNNGPIRGGIMDNLEMGVNWHLNNNLRVQFMYIHTDRYSLAPNQNSGWLNGFGMRTQFTF